MNDLNVLLNCSTPIVYSFRGDLPKSSSNMTGKGEFITNMIDFNTAGFIMLLLITFLLSFEYETLKKKVKIKIDCKRILQKYSVLLILLLLLPIIIAFLLLAYVYKLVCFVIIKKKDKHFAATLDSFDVFWSLEDDASKGIITVLGVVESKSSIELIDYVREKLQSIIVTHEAQKLFYRRSEDYGFYYWRKCCYVDVNQYVRVINVSNKTKLNESDLQKVLTEVSYQPMPFNDEGLFQILIANQKLDNENNNDHAIIFRIHHSVGDGVALIKFLCKTLSDEDDPIKFCLPEKNTMKSAKTPAYLLRMIILFFDMFSCFIDSLLREPDRSTLHGPSLIGKKIYKWIEPDERLFSMINDIKANVPDFKFSDILATALSCGLRDYFLKEVDPAPKSIAVILPIRFPSQENNVLKLENNFSVSILDLPIGTDIKDVKRCIERFQKSSDPLTNYYFLKICSILPKAILQPLFKSSQASMALSNLPGPETLSICGGDLKSLVFFLPNNGNTGLGVTALGYGGVLRFAAMADAALVPNSGELFIILEGMVNEIARMHDEYVLN